MKIFSNFIKTIVLLRRLHIRKKKGLYIWEGKKNLFISKTQRRQTAKHN
jgi:hypothetical protein